MKALFGSIAVEMRCRALGIDDSPVGIETRRKSVSQEHTFARDVTDIRKLKRYLLEMSEELTAQLRKDGECARTVVLKMRYPDFKTVTRRATMAQPTDLTEVIYAQVVALLQKEWQQGSRIRLIGLGLTGLVQARQLGLFEASSQRLLKLSQTVDQIRSKYGKRAIRRASLLEDDDE